jgi:hypothetical protein
MRGIESHVVHGDVIALARARWAIRPVRIRSNHFVSVIAPRAKRRVDYADGITILLNVMHAHDVDTSKCAERARGHGGGEAVGWGPVDDPPERGLAAGAEQHWVAQITQGAEEAQAGEVLGGTLPKAESRVKDQPFGCNAESSAARRNRHHLP